MSEKPADSDALPWYLKVIIAIAVLVVLFIIVIDLVTFAGQL
jgi:hypothetical protein